MGLAFAEHDVTVLRGNALEQLATLAPGSVHCAVTSPPYYGLRDYGTGRWDGGAAECDHRRSFVPESFDDPGVRASTLKSRSILTTQYEARATYTDLCGKCGAKRIDDQIGLESSPGEYVARMVAVFAELRRVLAADGVLWLNLGDSYATGTKGSGGTGDRSPMQQGAMLAGQHFEPRKVAMDRPAKNLLGMPWRTAFALQDDGWILRNAIAWHKPNAMPESVTDRLSTRYELVFLFSRSRRYWFDLDAIREPHTTMEPMHRTDSDLWVKTPGMVANNNRTGTVGAHDDGRNPGDVWTIPTSAFPGAHFACMPRALAERCIKAGCPPGGVVLDPFAGSGTTLAAARRLGHKSVGIELNPKYVDIITARIGPTPFDFGDVGDW